MKEEPYSFVILKGMNEMAGTFNFFHWWCKRRKVHAAPRCKWGTCATKSVALPQFFILLVKPQASASCLCPPHICTDPMS